MSGTGHNQNRRLLHEFQRTSCEPQSRSDAGEKDWWAGFSRLYKQWIIISARGEAGMPVDQTRDLSLSPDLKPLVHAPVASTCHQNAREAGRAGLLVQTGRDTEAPPVPDESERDGRAR